MDVSEDSHPYEYDSLPTGDIIRYLTLLPGSGTEPIRCTLHTARMAGAQFEAMSYVWGSDVRDQEILCNDHVFKVTTNLFRVLHRVRRSDQSRNLWADLICINQEDLDEKGHQVSIMGQIYRRASRVLILMGDDGGHGQKVVSLVDAVCNIIEKIIPSIDEGWNTFPFPREDEQILVDERWDSLSVLLKDTWFGRGWVVREAGFATDALVLWGKHEFSWDKLMRTINWLYKRAVKTLYAQGLDSRIPLAHLEVFEDRFPTYAKLFTTEMTWVDQSLLGYLSLTRQLKLKDPRDRIYAFLELVNTERRIYVRPNYKDHFLHVYQEFAVAYIRSTAYIGLLGNVEHDQESLAAAIPSWVPRWDLSLTRSGYSFGPPDSGYAGLQARDGSTKPPIILDFDTLQTHGAVFDTISYASDALDSTTTTSDTILAIWKAIESLRDHECPYPRKYRLAVLLTTLTAGTREGDIRDWLLSEATYYQEIHTECNYPNDLEPPNRWAGHLSSHMFHNMAKGYTHHRKIIVTKRGYLGLAPAVAEEGDACGILFGCTTPSILRQTDRSDWFQFLGATYILGKHHWFTQDGRAIFHTILGSEGSKDWTEWDVEEKDFFVV